MSNKTILHSIFSFFLFYNVSFTLSPHQSKTFRSMGTHAHLEQVLNCLDSLDHTTLLHPINWNDALKKTVSDREYGIPIDDLYSDDIFPRMSDKLTILNALKLRLITLPSAFLVPQEAIIAAKDFVEDEPTVNIAPTSSLDMKDEVCVRLHGDTKEMKCNIPIAEIEGYLERIFNRVNQFKEENTSRKYNRLLETIWPDFGKERRFEGIFRLNRDTGVCSWPGMADSNKRNNFLKSHFNEFESFVQELYPELHASTCFFKEKENPRWGFNFAKGRNVTTDLELASDIDGVERCSMHFEFKRSSIGEKIDKFLQDRELMIQNKEDESNTFNTSIFYQLILQLLSCDTDSGFLTDARRFFFWKLADVDENDDTKVIPFDFLYMDSWFIDINDETVFTPWLVILFCFLRDIDPSLNDQRKRNFKHFLDSIIANCEEDGERSDDNPSIDNQSRKSQRKSVNINIVTKPSVLECAIVMSSNYFTRVMIFDTSYFQMDFKRYFENVDIHSSKVVLKIYDRVKIERSYYEDDSWLIGKDEYKLNEFVDRVLDINFANELKALKRIESHNKTNGEVRIKVSRLIAHGEFMSRDIVCMETFNAYDTQIIGPFILIEFIPNDFSNITNETILDGIRQLREMANIGVYNQDIRKENMMFPSIGTVIFIDYSHTKFFQATSKLVEKYSTVMVENFTESIDDIREKYEV